MHTSLFKTSLYTRSLLANPPAALPQIPTLAELKERTASIPIPIPTSSNNDESNTSSVGWSSLPKSLLPSYSNSPPPSYAPTSVKSWARLDDGEVKREVTMKGSKQPDIGQFEGRSEKKGWISWSVQSYFFLSRPDDIG
jgi:hypothetical protein